MCMCIKYIEIGVEVLNSFGCIVTKLYVQVDYITETHYVLFIITFILYTYTSTFSIDNDSVNVHT